MTGNSRYDVIVIGAGHNGLTCAAALARRGRRVLVLERREVVGGLAVGEPLSHGCRTVGAFHDTCCVRPAVVESLQLQRFGLKLGTDAPPVFAPQSHGRGLLLDRDGTELEGQDRNRYAEFRGFLARIASFAGPRLDDVPPRLLAAGSRSAIELLAAGWAMRRLGRRDMLELLRVVPMSLSDWLGEWFDSDLVRSVIAAPALTGTMTGPWSPGGAGNLIRWASLAGKPVIGGPAALIDALKSAAEVAGAEIRTGAEVESIRTAGDRVVGVTLCSGEMLDAPIIAASCDPKTALLRLVGGRRLAPAWRKRVESIRSRGTTAKVDLLLSSPLRFTCRPDVPVERTVIGESLTDWERAYDAVKYRRFSPWPVLDVYCPTAGTMPGNGRHLVSILANFVPYELEGGWTDEQREGLGDAVVASLARYAPEVASNVVARAVLTPVDIEQRFGPSGGHIHHGEHALDQLLVRPTPECSRYAAPIAGLYLCGSGSHPGGGLTCAPGWIAAGVIARAAR